MPGPTNWTLINQWAVIDNKDVEFILEEFRHEEQQMMFVHLSLKSPCTPKLLKWMLDTWRVFTKHVTCPLFTCNSDEDEKWRNFISIFGFKPFTEITWSDGTRRRLYWHDNEQIPKQHSLQHKQQLEHLVRLDDGSGRLPASVSATGVLGRNELTGTSGE